MICAKCGKKLAEGSYDEKFKWRGIKIHGHYEYLGECYCVDCWEGSLDWSEEARKKAIEENVYGLFISNMERLGIKVQMLKGLSTEMAVNFSEEELGLVFIDASHDFDSVWSDLECYFPKVKSGGIISGHNYDSHGDVKKAVDKFLGEKDLKPEMGTGSIWHATKK